MAPQPITSPKLVVSPPALYEALRTTAHPVLAAARTAARRAEHAPVDSRTPMALGFSGLGFAAVCFVVLHVLAPTTLNPLREPMSDYALADGVGWLFPLGIGFIAIGGVGGTLGLARAGLLNIGLLRWAMGVIVVSAVATAVFPTDEEFPLSLTAEIHRYAAITLFIAVPVAAVLAAVALGRDSWLLGAGLVATGLLVVFLLSHLSVMPQALQDLRGLFQRALVVVDLVMLGRLYVAAHRVMGPNTVSGVQDTASGVQDTMQDDRTDSVVPGRAS